VCALQWIDSARRANKNLVLDADGVPFQAGGRVGEQRDGSE